MSLDSQKDLVRRFYSEVINDRDVEAIDRLLTEDFVHNGEQRGREGQKAGVRAFLDAFPDLHDEILLLFAQGELVCAHQRWTGRHSGEFLGVPATGRAVAFTTTAILRIEGDLIAQAWDEGDYLGLMSQLQA